MACFPHHSWKGDCRSYWREKRGVGFLGLWLFWFWVFLCMVQIWWQQPQIIECFQLSNQVELFLLEALLWYFNNIQKKKSFSKYVHIHSFRECQSRKLKLLFASVRHILKISAEGKVNSFYWIIGISFLWRGKGLLYSFFNIWKQFW